MITVENLSFTYRKSKRAVLHDFSLSFESGRVYGLLGKNGAGKSTLLYLMSGLLTPKNGKVVFHDTDVRRRLPVTEKESIHELCACYKHFSFVDGRADQRAGYSR